MTPATRPLGTGIALAITVGVFYVLCTLIWVLAARAVRELYERPVPRHGLQQHGSTAAVRLARVSRRAGRAEWVGAARGDVLRLVAKSIDRLTSTRFPEELMNHDLCQHDAEPTPFWRKIGRAHV